MTDGISDRSIREWRWDVVSTAGSHFSLLSSQFVFTFSFASMFVVQPAAFTTAVRGNGLSSRART